MSDEVPEQRHYRTNNQGYSVHHGEIDEKSLHVHYRIRATPLPGEGNRSNTAGSCPGPMSRGLEAIRAIRSWAARFDAASSVCAMGPCFSRFSYRYTLSEASPPVPAAVFTPTYCDWKVCLPPVYTVMPGMISRASPSTRLTRPASFMAYSIVASAESIAFARRLPAESMWCSYSSRWIQIIAFGNRSAPSRWSQCTCEMITSVTASGRTPNRASASAGVTYA